MLKRLIERVSFSPRQWIGAGILALTFWGGVPLIEDGLTNMTRQKMDNLLAHHDIKETDENIATFVRVQNHYQEMGELGFKVGVLITVIISIAITMIFSDPFNRMTLKQKKQYAENLLAAINHLELEVEVKEALEKL